MNCCEKSLVITSETAYNGCAGFVTGAAVSLVAHSNVIITGSLGATSFVACMVFSKLADLLDECGAKKIDVIIMSKIKAGIFLATNMAAVVSGVALGVIGTVGGLVIGAFAIVVFVDQIRPDSRIEAMRYAFDNPSDVMHRLTNEKMKIEESLFVI